MDNISLFELNRKIAEVVTATFDDLYWIVAEVSEIRVAANGHCYLELIEKAARNTTIVARARATVWSNRWTILRQFFEEATNQRLSAGMKILVCVQVQMHEAYGYSLNIVDIDPSFTLGEMAMRRQEIIKQLTTEGLIDMNKEVEMPIAPQRIAIISASNAAGYGDFCHQLVNNDYGVVFYTHLFSASMQGSNTEGSIITALNKIYDNIDNFDVVVIIRGGGGVADLSSFDSYELAVNIANFPLPVIVGIGHERDKTVLDVVANKSVKTPTAAAAYLIDILADQLLHIDELKKHIIDTLQRLLDLNKTKINNCLSTIRGSQIKLRDQLNYLEIIKERVKLFSAMKIENETKRQKLLENSIQLCRPENILNRGFSITRINGKTIKNISDIPQDTIIETQTSSGIIKSKKI